MSQASIILSPVERAAKRSWYEPILDSGVLPDWLIRAGIRKRLAARIARERAGGPDARSERFRNLIRKLHESPIADRPHKANQQHYELPAEFFQRCLGARLKYSSGLWSPGVSTLDQAEEAMLALTCERAGIRDGMTVLDLGCGWGSLSLWVCEKFPASRVLAVSNSRPQREFILARAAERGFTNLEVITADANVFDTDRRFDRVVSVEMFEHMKNYDALLEKIAGWLNPDGRLFVHIFTHRDIAYEFDEGDDWIGRYFFTAGVMPSDDSLAHFQRSVHLVDHWRVDGTHYSKTAEAWLANMDRAQADVRRVLVAAYGQADAPKWVARWRVFYLACAELWGFRGGSEWMVSHYLFEPRQG